MRSGLPIIGFNTLIDYLANCHLWNYMVFCFLCKLHNIALYCFFSSYLLNLQVRLCREKKSGNIFAMKKLKKSEMVKRGQVRRCRITFPRETTAVLEGITFTFPVSPIKYHFHSTFSLLLLESCTTLKPVYLKIYVIHILYRGEPCNFLLVIRVMLLKI